MYELLGNRVAALVGGTKARWHGVLHGRSQMPSSATWERAVVVLEPRLLFSSAGNRKLSLPLGKIIMNPLTTWREIKVRSGTQPGPAVVPLGEVRPPSTTALPRSDQVRPLSTTALPWFR